jgi:hypothetical protein
VGLVPTARPNITKQNKNLIPILKVMVGLHQIKYHFSIQFLLDISVKNKLLFNKYYKTF